MPLDIATADTSERPDRTRDEPSFSYRCKCCKAPSRLSDLNDGMLCKACGEPEEDPEYTLDLSDVAMLREHGTYR